MDYRIEIHNPVAGGHDVLVGLLQHFSRIASPVDFVGVGEKLANIAQRRGSQQGIGHGMQQRIGIAMPDRMLVVRHFNPAQQKWPAKSEPVAIFAQSNP